jgi:hypothetical protein
MSSALTRTLGDAKLRSSGARHHLLMALRLYGLFSSQIVEAIDQGQFLGNLMIG